jgi:t-SNARE complex subunit (syntaxin)
MHELEIRLKGEKFIANRMCEYLPNKTNKQIRDKRNEKTYKEQLKNLFERNHEVRAPMATGNEYESLEDVN